MADIFQPFIQKLVDLGFYNFFFPWLITAAIMYGLFRKSKVLGDSPFMNGTIALAISFLVIGFPVVFGNPSFFALPMSAFFTQATVVILFIAMGFIAASMFYPNMLDWLPQVFKHRTMLTMMIAVGFGLFITSGMLNVLLVGWNNPKDGGTSTPRDVLIVVAGIIIFVIVLIIATAVARSSE